MIVNMMHGYNHNTDDKAQLINDNLDIVKKIAFFYVGRVGKVVEVDDLLQLGMVGLIELLIITSRKKMSPLLIMLV